MTGDASEVVCSKVANYKAGPMNWVGGRITLTREALGFAPNGLNKAMTGDRYVEVPLHEIDEVRFRRGVVTSIIVVRGVRGEERFRCWGAKDVVRLLRELTGQA